MFEFRKDNYDDKIACVHILQIIMNLFMTPFQKHKINRKTKSVTDCFTSIISFLKRTE